MTGIWFFFWAKNGGFYFKEDDWDDYKSTVLRRKGPNGTTLSGATVSTDLGGGSIVHGEKRSKKKKKKEERYKDFDPDEDTAYTGSTLGSELSELKQKVKKERKFGRKKKRTEMSEVGTDVGTALTGDIDGEEMDVGVQETIRAYRHEKPAKVGGLNKQPDASTWDGSNTNDGSTVVSDLLSHREKTPTNTPTKSKKEKKETHTGGIRKVAPSTNEGSSGFWSKSSGAGTKSKTLLDTTHENHIKAEAQRLQEKGRAAQRRDFSFQVGEDVSTVDSEAHERERADRAARKEERERRRANRSPNKKVPGSWNGNESEVGSSVLGSDISGDIGTKSYHHPIPGLSSTAGSEYADERRKKRNGGYRRGRGDDLEE